jgi:aspartate-semialdehyde dehydrogenase
MPTVAVVGAGSLQGRELLAELEGHPRAGELSLFSEKAVGTELPFRGVDLVVEELDEDALAATPEVVFFTSGAERSRRWARRFAEAGSRVVDLSSAFRLDPEVPLVGLGAAPSARILSVPTAAALATGRLLAPVFGPGKSPQARLFATLLVPVSAAGQAGVLELSKQTADLLGGRPPRPRKFPHRIAFNLVPEVGQPAEAGKGDTALEHSFRVEVRRLWKLPDLPVNVIAVRVPVFFGLGLALSGTTGDPQAAETLREAFGPKSGVKLLDRSGAPPMPSLSVGDASILAGRIRSDGGAFELFATVDALKLVADCAVTAGLGPAR